MAGTSVAPVLLTIFLAGSPAVGEDGHLISLADVEVRMRDGARSAPPGEAAEPSAGRAAPLSEEERDELRRRADALATDPRGAGLPGALEGVLGFVAGVALTFVLLAARN
jgi:hypothetical protein